jgi:signal transduction histidine kinase
MNALEIIQVPTQTVQKWQEIIDLLAEILHVPSALIMKVEHPNIRVFLSSETEGNPYERDELACLNTGLYCETVMKTRELLRVPNALVDQEWKANPDIKLGMVSYMGFPVAWPNGDIFGTICVLDSKPNGYSEQYRKLLFQCREMLQADLKSLQAGNELELKVRERTDELRRNEAYLIEAQKLSRTGNFGWNVSSGKIFWSAESYRIFAYDKAVSPTIDMVLQRVHPEDIALVKSTIDRASSDGRDFDLEYRLLMPDGSVRNIHVVARAVQDEAGQLEFNGALLDVTAAKRAEEELHKARAELAHVTRVTTLGQLTASIGHEIRQPLSSIASFSTAGLNWLKRQPPNVDEVRSGLENIINQVHRIDEVIKSVNALFKNESTARTEVNLNTLVQQVLTSTARAVASNEIVLETNFADNPSPYVMANPGQLQQVFLNLITNAIEAMSAAEHGARTLRIETSIDQADSVLITVADSGPGIDSKVAEQIFKPFFTTKSGGMGLGLPICLSVIEVHNGKLTVASREPCGSVFRIVLPRDRHE